MRKVALIFSFLIAISGSAFSQGYAKNVRCEASAARALSRNHEVCRAEKEPVSYYRCQINIWEAFGKSTCSNFGRSSASNQIFIFNRLISNYEDAINGRISIDTQRQQRNQLVQMSVEEFERMDRFIDSELNDMEQSQSVRRSYNFFENAVRMLGGSVGGVNQSNGFTTYIFNGRAITCSTMGSFVTCN